MKNEKKQAKKKSSTKVSDRKVNAEQLKRLTEEDLESVRGALMCMCY
jgi:hypothetical protein